MSAPDLGPTTCAACGQRVCQHPDPVYAGILPRDGMANAVTPSGAVTSRAGFYSAPASEVR